MDEFYFVAEDPTISVSRYASRISQPVWRKHRSLIQNLHEKGLTRRDMLKELASHDFHPSFGQLVAQMTRWQLVRYSKPAETPTIRKDFPPPGILGLTTILLAGHPPCRGVQGGSPLAYECSAVPEISLLMTALSTNPSADYQLHDFDMLPANDHYYSCRQLLNTADVLFLGESYTHAFHMYRDLERRLSSSLMTVEEEQLLVQAIIGCLKSAANNHQRDEGISIAQNFLDHLRPETTSAVSTNSDLEKVNILTTFDEWHDGDCATVKAIFDLLTTYKKPRSWQTPFSIRWANQINIREFACLRLVRVPTWQEACTFFNSMHVSCVPPATVFGYYMPKLILTWALRALQEFREWYDEQVLELESRSGVPRSTFRSLLFWRFDFFSRHTDACPPLSVHLSYDTTYHLPVQQTVCTLAHMVFEHEHIPITSDAHRKVLYQMRSTIDEEHNDTVLASFWHGLRAALAPSYAERSRHSST